MSRLPRPLPAPPPAAPNPAAFMLCPLTCLPAEAQQQQPWQQALYLWAFEQAQKAAQPSILERDLLGVWN